ncbi:Serine/threonine-protein phosphatase 2A activator [Caenorhabditis elegans]|uniref:Serine/threonine-protein phosphatase 2A activator n=1 Tax=Caenorhabditis elegans TaxID=6239 RepID=Q9BL35_CAEEL|nr:Serine/threonine-protein phosphatase 2A activator [Caenorhabditis elegans]CCD73872.1 Serine/threonine-protein phosphatase 2A activator [Caenorhabditis elegans]|eukprot:NP_497617.1 Serine/threonine-protein phosphatase 2A activator [Caenorhabditis elegans]
MAENSYKPPEKMIKNVFDLNPWYFSKAYEEYLAFLHRLNDSVVGVHTTADMRCTDLVISFIDMLDKLEKWAEEIPLEDVSEQRFGNKAYRKFYEKLCKESPDLLASVLPENVHDALVELVPYFTESFGNATRIDYGSGHEANFLILLFCLQKLGVFTENDDKVLVLRIFNKYLRVCRHLQTRFKMEPAGSRGVHAIDDFQFAPFIFGSAQLIGSKSIVPDSYLKKNIVETHAHTSLFLDCVNFINQTKTGPFHEHSNQLWNISAVPHWKKVNSGMFKMYEGEVLKKFPVVQHMMFGSLFSFDRSEHPRESMEDAPSQDPMPPRAPAQHGMFAFKIPSAANTSTVHSSSVVESGDLRRLHSEKHPNEHCPPPMADA